MRCTLPLLVLTLALLFASACSDESARAEGGPDAESPDQDVDSAPDNPNAALCDTLGLPSHPFQEAGGGLLFGDVASDFSVSALDGTAWRLSEHWSGCGSYVFIGYIPTSTGQYEQTYWASSPAPLVATELNTHIFFLSFETDEVARRARVQDMADRVDEAIAALGLDAASAAAQRERFQFVVDVPTEVEGSVGAFLTDYLAYANDPASRVDLGDRGMAPPPLPFMFAIDRDQRWDSGGSVDELVGGAPSLRMASYLPPFFDYKAGVRDRLAAESDVLVIDLLDERVTDRVFERTVELPPAAELASYDTLQVDVEVFCPARNVFACSEWDRIARVSVCSSDDCAERRELVRWITPYWRRGQRRWLIEASWLLGLLADGGPQTFFIEMGPGFERATERDARISLRLSNRGFPDRAVGTDHAFAGGGFGAEYNSRDPFTFTPPASAGRVELVVLLSGHGQEAANNCAEWCDHRHQFNVNGRDLSVIRHEGSIGSIAGCGDAARDGVPPGQWGNWAPERAYWCPGLPVTPIVIDITADVTPGEANTLTYAGSYAGGTPAGGTIDLSAYIVWYE